MSTAQHAWAGLEVTSSESDTSSSSGTSLSMGGVYPPTERVQGKKPFIKAPAGPQVHQGGSGMGAVQQGEDHSGVQHILLGSERKKPHSTNSGTLLDDMEVVSESDFDHDGPPPIPHGWEDAFNTVDESSEASIQIFNAHITHLRWTYRCLLAHYNHCLATKRLLSTQKGALDRTIFTQWASHCLHSTIEPLAV